MQYKYAMTEDREIVLAPYKKNAFIDEVLPPGFYSARNVGGLGPIIPLFLPVKSIDNLVRFKTGLISDVIEKATAFLSPDVKTIYDELGVGHKVGMLFYGKPGTGKTCSCRLIIDEMINKYNAVCLDGTGENIGFILAVIELIRTQQNNPIVLFVDEFENAVGGSSEAPYLTFLDGNTSVSNLIFLACTNYIGNIPDRIKNRKSRIKYTYNIDSLPLPVYEEYLKEKVKRLPEAELKAFALMAHKKSITLDELKHSALDYLIENITIEKAIIQATTNTNSVNYNESKSQPEESFADKLADRMAKLMIGGKSIQVAKDIVIEEVYEKNTTNEQDIAVLKMENELDVIGEEVETGGSDEEEEEDTQVEVSVYNESYNNSASVGETQQFQALDKMLSK